MNLNIQIDLNRKRILVDMEITEPTLLLDLQKCKNNIRKMVEKANKNKLIFRPHFKTHQSIQIGEIFKEFGVDKITVSSVEMAQYFTEAGWEDITIAFPFNPLEISEIEQLSDRINLNILISSLESAEKLIEVTDETINYFIEIDAGYNRSGILAEYKLKRLYKFYQIITSMDSSPIPAIHIWQIPPMKFSTFISILS